MARFRSDPSRVGFTRVVRDLAQESVRRLFERPVRTAAAAIGTAMGVGSLVVVIGLTASAEAEIASQFVDLEPVILTLEPSAESQLRFASPFAWNRLDSATRVSGVRSATFLAIVPISGPVQPRLVEMRSRVGADVTVFAASPGLSETLGVGLAEGRGFDIGHHQRNDRTAIVGLLAAQRLNLTNIRTQPSITIDGRIFSVIGILDQVDERGNLLDSVIIPASTARSLWRVGPPTELYARVERGAAAAVAGKLAIVMSPNDPSDVNVEVASQLSELGNRISEEIGRLLIGVGVTLVLVGTVNIAGIAVLDTTERTSEIGLRMAVGARRRGGTTPSSAPRRLSNAGSFKARGLTVGVKAVAAQGEIPKGVGKANEGQPPAGGPAIEPSIPGFPVGEAKHGDE